METLVEFYFQMNSTVSSLEKEAASLSDTIKEVNSSLLLRVTTLNNYNSSLTCQNYHQWPVGPFHKIIFSSPSPSLKLGSRFCDSQTIFYYFLQLQNSSNLASGLPGPAGLNGSRGPPGPQGSGNFTLCRYNSKQGLGSAGDLADLDAIIIEAVVSIRPWYYFYL